MFKEYHGQVERIYEIDDTGEITLENFSEIKNPYALYDYIISRKYYSEMALKYIEEELFFYNPQYCTMFCLEYGYEIEDMSSVKRLRLDKLDMSLVQDLIFHKFWDLLQYEEYAGLILDVIGHFNWTNHFYESLIEHNGVESKICAELILEGESARPYQDAEEIYSHIKYCKEEDNGQISIFEGRDDILPRIRYTELAMYYANIGWNGQSLDYIKAAEKEKTYKSLPDYNDIQLKQLKTKILNSYQITYEEIENSLSSILQFLTPNAKEALINAEYLFHVHGEALNEYSSIISGYARCIEIQLKEVFLEKLYDLLDRYGSQNKNDKTKKSLIYLSYSKKNNKIERKKISNKDSNLTLGNFYHLFYIPHDDMKSSFTIVDELKWEKTKCLNKCKEECRKLLNEEKKDCETKCIEDCENETFYGAMYKEYKTGISYERLFEFGKLLKEITADFRNEASHSSIKDFDKVTGIREKMGIGNRDNIFELLYSTKGNPLKKI